MTPLNTESLYWKYMAEQLGKSGGQYWPLANDFLAEHQQEYFHYEAERQSAQ